MYKTKNRKIINISEKTHALLVKVKIIPRESFDSAIQRLAEEYLSNRDASE